LFNVGAGDPATFAIVTMVMVGSALVACAIPAARAAAVEPAALLRND
jgi:ABC-type lipoprotein release transport system permease subunit